MIKSNYIRYMAILAMVTPALFAEPSVYSKTVTYGGSDSATIYSLRQQVASLKEEVDGLKSIVESLSARAGKSSGTTGGNLSEIENLRERVERLETIVHNSSNGKQTSLPVKKSDSSYKKTAATAKPVNKSPNSANSSSNLNSAPSSKLYSRGVILFDKKSYSEAKKRFEILLKRNYKPAASNFYMGEIAYRTGRYRDAIKYYQRSAELNENAAYMDRLLLHTGISLENDGDREQARRFYQAIVDAYPGTSSARVAKKRLK